MEIFPGEGNLYLGSMQAITSAVVKLVEIERNRVLKIESIMAIRLLMLDTAWCRVLLMPKS